jgi:hypothetical protein
MKAQIVPDEIEVHHSSRPSVGREFLTIDCPNGWDDVKKLTKKVLTYQGRKFTYCSWNSDRNECTFFRMLNQARNENVAKVS